MTFLVYGEEHNFIQKSRDVNFLVWAINIGRLSHDYTFKWPQISFVGIYDPNDAVKCIVSCCNFVIVNWQKEYLRFNRDSNTLEFLEYATANKRI